MVFPNFQLAALALTALLSSPASSQLNFPQCIRNCIDASDSASCRGLDIACLCRASSGNFLPEVASCMHDKCVDISPSILLGPLQFACQIAGASIPQDKIDAAESAAKSGVVQTSTETETQQQTITSLREFTRVTSVTVTTTAEGTTQLIVFPVTIERTRTVSGDPSTVTKEKTKTKTASGEVRISTVTTTNQQGSTVTERTTITSLPSSLYTRTSGQASDDGESTTTILTSTTVAGQAFTSTDSTTGGAQSTQSGSNRPASETNSSPFLDSNTASGIEIGKWFGLVVFIAVAFAWL